MKAAGRRGGRAQAAAPAPVPVLFVSHSSHLYGAQRSLLDLVAGLRERGRVLPVVATPPGPLADRLVAAGATVLVQRVPWWIEREGAGRLGILGRAWRRWRQPLLARGAARSLVEALRARGLAPAAVHTNVLATDVGHRAARLLGVPHVWHVREFVEADIGHRWTAGRRRSLGRVRRAAAVVFNSQATRDHFAADLQGADLRVVYNGFRFPAARRPAARQRGGTRGAARLLTVGHLRPGKGHGDAIQALAHLRRRGWDAELRVAGVGRPDWEAALRDQARQAGVAEHVRFLGHVEGLEGEYAAADAVLACSPHEPFGRAVVEALAHGCPVVAADAAGFRETVRDGRGGLLYPPGDAEALAGRVEAVLRDPAGARRMAEAGRRDAERRFAMDAYVSAMEDVLLGAARGPEGVGAPGRSSGSRRPRHNPRT